MIQDIVSSVTMFFYSSLDLFIQQCQNPLNILILNYSLSTIMCLSLLFIAILLISNFAFEGNQTCLVQLNALVKK